MPSETIRTTHCEGCDQDAEGVKVYRVRFAGDKVWETARYCEDCAGLAGINWSGTISEIEDGDRYDYEDSGLHYVGNYDEED